MAVRYHPVHALPLPRVWLMTDERLGDGLLAAIAALPRRSGVIFRHYSLSDADRRALFKQVRAAARARGHMLLFAGTPRQARALRADGAHGRSQGCFSAPVHDRRERLAAERRGAQMILISPVYPTRSHPGARTLGPMGYALLSRGAQADVIALGGMTKARFRGLGGWGWAAIDALHKPIHESARVCHGLHSDDQEIS